MTTHTTHSDRPRGTRRTGGRAFTLVELLIVVSIIAIGATLMVPAFAEVLRSINYSGAINQVTAALGNARAQAIRTGRHAGVVFLFDIETETASVQVVELLQPGALTEFGTAPLEETIGVAMRPAPGQVPVQLPRGTAVVGLSLKTAQADVAVDTASSFTTWSWYAGQTHNPEDDDPIERLPLWLFPQNDARLFTKNNPPVSKTWGVDPWEVLADRTPTGANVSVREATEAVRHAQSFMVVFSPSGSVVSEIESGATIVKNAWLEFPDQPIPRSAPTGSAYDWRDRFDPQNLGDGLGGSSETDATLPSGRGDIRPNPEVFLRAAEQVAVVDISTMARDLGVARPWLVRPEESNAPIPKWVRDQVGRAAGGGTVSYIAADTDNATNPPLHRIVSKWIDDNAEVLSFSRYTGEIIRRTAR
jgi:prepilin-type N-terminal cleavage/methylation domain-containing protein